MGHTSSQTRAGPGGRTCSQVAGWRAPDLSSPHICGKSWTLALSLCKCVWDGPSDRSIPPVSYRCQYTSRRDSLSAGRPRRWPMSQCSKNNYISGCPYLNTLIVLISGQVLHFNLYIQLATTHEYIILWIHKMFELSQYCVPVLASHSWRLLTAGRKPYYLVKVKFNSNDFMWFNV